MENDVFELKFEISSAWREILWQNPVLRTVGIEEDPALCVALAKELIVEDDDYPENYPEAMRKAIFASRVKAALEKALREKVLPVVDKLLKAPLTPDVLRSVFEAFPDRERDLAAAFGYLENAPEETGGPKACIPYLKMERRGFLMGECLSKTPMERLLRILAALVGSMSYTDGACPVKGRSWAAVLSDGSRGLPQASVDEAWKDADRLNRLAAANTGKPAAVALVESLDGRESLVVWNAPDCKPDIPLTVHARYEAILEIPVDILEKISDYLDLPVKGVERERCQGEDDTIAYTAKFENGFQADIKYCGTNDGASYAEMVLFDPHGCEVACSEPADEFLGGWTLDHGGVSYVVTVIPEKSK